MFAYWAALILGLGGIGVGLITLRMFYCRGKRLPGRRLATSVIHRIEQAMGKRETLPVG